MQEVSHRHPLEVSGDHRREEVEVVQAHQTVSSVAGHVLCVVYGYSVQQEVSAQMLDTIRPTRRPPRVQHEGADYTGTPGVSLPSCSIVVHVSSKAAVSFQPYRSDHVLAAI